MMTTIILGVKAISFLLLLLPVVDLVDQHQNGEWAVGERKPGVIPHTGRASDNQTRVTAGALGAGGTIPGNWNSLSTLSDMGTASSNGNGYFKPSPSAIVVSSSSSSSSLLGEKRYFTSPSFTSSSSSSSGGTTKHHHSHGHSGTPVTTVSATVSSQSSWSSHAHPMTNSRTGEQRAHSDFDIYSQKQRASDQLVSLVVEPPLSLASSTRVTGPFFESKSNKTTIHITARAGQTVMLDCAVVLLQGRTVSWLRRRKDSLQLLTVGNTTYNSDSRLGLRFRYPNNWRLGIDSVNKGDEGEYQCQLSTHPPKALIYHVKVIAPAVIILDENGHTVTERHYKVDSSLHLTCRASHVDKFVENVVWLKGDRVLPGGDSRIKVKLTKNQTNGEATAFLSVLSVRKGDSGNYTCRASSLATSTIAVHVLNGELPAAVQHESSANRLVVPASGLSTVILMSAPAFVPLINVVICPTSHNTSGQSPVPLFLLLFLAFPLLSFYSFIIHVTNWSAALFLCLLSILQLSPCGSF